MTTGHLMKRARAWISQPRMVHQDRIITRNEEDRCLDPIFLIGLHRSGTSLMRRVFNAHPDIACPPESFFMAHFAAMLRDKDTVAGYRAFGHDPDSMRAHIASLASELHEGFRRANGKRRWADKTPSYVALVETLREMFGPDARFVMIYRHPFDVAFSIDDRGWNVTDQPGAYSFDGLMDHMQRMYRLQMEFETAHAEQCARVFYEDVVARPEETLTALMAALDEPFASQMLRHHEAQHNFGTEDPIARGLKGFQPSHGKWTGWPPEKIETACQALGGICAELGYSIDTALAATGGRG